MVGLTAKGEKLVLDTVLTSRFLSLHTADPVETGAGEVAGGAYARQAMTFANTGANPTTATLSALVQYPAATASWGNITHVGIWSAATGGDLLMSAAVTLPKAVAISDVARFQAGSIVVTAD